MRTTLLLALLATRLTPLLSSQGSEACKDALVRQGWEDRSSPVYFDATELGRELNARGIRVDCIRRSKEEAMFNGQKGAAWFATDHGVFDVWFLPNSETFDGLKIREQGNHVRGYIYSFRGTPQATHEIGSSKPLTFLKHGNAMFEVWGDERLASALKQAFQNP